MPIERNPRIPPRTPEQLAEEKAIHERASRERPRVNASSAIRMQDYRELSRVVAALEKACAQQGLNIAQLAERCHTDEKELSQLFAMRTANPSIAILFRVATALRFDLSFVLKAPDAEETGQQASEPAASGA